MTVSVDGTLGVSTPAVILQGSGSGSITLVAPAVAGATTITFPVSSGTALLQAPSGALTLTNTSGGTLILQPAPGAGSTTITLPATAGSSGQYLQTDGAGVTTWASAAGGGLTIGTTAIASGTTGSILINTSSVLQQLIMGTGVSALLAAAAGGANGIATLNGTGVLPTTQGGTGLNALGTGVSAALAAGTNGPNGFVTLDGSGALPASSSATFGTASSTTGTISLYNSGSAFPLNLQSGANSATWTLTLPTGPGTAGQVLTTNGSGVTSWTTVGSGTVNSGTANEIAFYSATGTAVSGNANATITAGALTLGVAASVAGSVKLSGSTSGTVTVASAAAAGTWTLTLPTTGGTNGYVLTTDGAGVTSWSTAAASSATGGNFDIGTGGTTTGTLNLYNSGTANGVTIRSGVNTSAWSLTLPTGPGTNGQILTTDGTGATTWTSGSVTIGTTAINLGATSLTLAGVQTITLTQDPTSGLEAATKQYVDANIDPLNRISPVDAATLSNVASLTGAQTIDGVSLVAGQRVLLIGQTTPSENGIWQIGAPWIRPADADVWSEIVAASVFVLAGGATLGSTSWVQTAPAGGTINVTAQSWSQQSALNNYNAGLGISIVAGNTITNTGVVSISSGTTGLTATITPATGDAVLGGTLAITNGGTGATTAIAALTALLPTQAGNTGKFLQTVAGTPQWTTAVTGAAGANTQVQYNNAGALAGEAAFAYAGSGVLNLGVAGASTGNLVLAGATSGTVTIKPALAAGGWTLTLPATDGAAGEVLTTDGAGVTSWTAPAASSAAGGTFNVGTGGTTQGNLNLYNSTNASGVTITSGVNTAAWTLTLPVNDGAANQVLTTDGNGVTSWTTVGSGTVNSGTANQMAFYSATGTAVSGNANATISSGSLTLGVATSVAGELKLSGSTSGVVTINTAAAAGSWTMTLPATAGTANQVLTTDGAGVTSWSTPTGGGTPYVRTEYTATAGQTTFAATYVAGFIDVFYNGVMLASSDYTATSGTDVVLATGATLGAVVTIVVYKTSVSGSSAFTQTQITATAGQTSFTATYTPGYAQVFVNGVLMAQADYTATTGTSVVLATPASAGDIIIVANFA